MLWKRLLHIISVAFCFIPILIDSTYRDFLKKSKITVETIKNHFTEILKTRVLIQRLNGKREGPKIIWTWFDGKDIIRLALLIASHDTIPDTTNKGIVKLGKSWMLKISCLEKWLSNDLKTIETYVRINKDNMWMKLYMISILKLIRLLALNSVAARFELVAGNKGWKRNCFIIKVSREKDPAKIDDIKTSGRIRNRFQSRHDTIFWKVILMSIYRLFLPCLLTMSE